MRTFKRGDPDPTDVHAVITSVGSTFVRSQHGRWCNAKHTNEQLSDNHRGASWTFLTARCGPLMAVPSGLCADRNDHAPHVHESATLGTFWCTADQTTRLPFAAEARRKQSHE